MKSVLISIQPQHIENICTVIDRVDGKPIYKKTIEVRKTRPKLKTPFKCYIYATKSNRYLLDMDSTGGLFWWDKKSPHYPFKDDENLEETFNGKVIGEFVCDEIFIRPANTIYLPNAQKDYLDLLKTACLTEKEALDYMGGNYSKDMYFWHISDLKIYDTPKALGDFCVCSNNIDCNQCAHVPLGMHPQEFVWHNDFCGECRKLSYKSMWATHFRKRLIRPPQSWYYVEEL